MMRFILLVAIFFGFSGFGQVKPLTLQDIPEEVKKVVDCSTLVFTVTKQPEFPGGLGEFKKNFSENFDSMALKNAERTLNTVIYFVVEPDGSVNRIKAKGNNAEFDAEAERTISAIKTKYEPASVNNLPVRYLMRFPLTMNFK